MVLITSQMNMSVKKQYESCFIFILPSPDSLEREKMIIFVHEPDSFSFAKAARDPFADSFLA